MSVYRMVYKGNRKINAIKAVRMICAIGLKESKDAVENSQGLIVYASSCAAIVAEYSLACRRGPNGDDSINTGDLDWSVGEYDRAEPTDLRGQSPSMDAVLRNCRVLT